MKKEIVKNVLAKKSLLSALLVVFLFLVGVSSLGYYLVSAPSVYGDTGSCSGFSVDISANNLSVNSNETFNVNWGIGWTSSETSEGQVTKTVTFSGPGGYPSQTWTSVSGEYPQLDLTNGTYAIQGGITEDTDYTITGKIVGAMDCPEGKTDSKTVTISLSTAPTIPPTIPPSTYTVSRIIEGEVTPGCTGPDLTASTPIPAGSAGSVTFSSKMTNNGSGASSSVTTNFTNLFEVSTSSDGKDNLLSKTKDTTGISSSSPLSSPSGTTNVTSPSFNLSSGTYYVRACADSTNLISEMNEGNNCSDPWAQVIITPACVPPAGSSCTSTQNTCGQTNGTVQADCSCLPPPDSSCPANGGWSAWSACGGASCGQPGTQTRTCISPPCSGSSSQGCNMPACTGTDGQCSSPRVRDTCAPGSTYAVGSDKSSPSLWIWTCNGTGTGASIQCSQKKSPGYEEK